MVGLEGDPFRRKVLGLPVSAPVVVVVVEVLGIVEIIAGVEVFEVIPPVVVIGTSSGSPNDTTGLFHFPGQRSAELDARASSGLTSLIPLDSPRDIYLSSPWSIRCSL